MDLINQLFAFFLRAFLLVVGMVFVLGLMAFAALFLLVAVVWSLITGKKHPVHVVWQRARSTRDQVWRASRGGGFGRKDTAETNESRRALADITDVQDLSDKR